MSFKIEEDTRYLLIVEGIDDKAFFQKLVKNNVSNLQILTYDGADDSRLPEIAKK